MNLNSITYLSDVTVDQLEAAKKENPKAEIKIKSSSKSYTVSQVIEMKKIVKQIKDNAPVFEGENAQKRTFAYVYITLARRLKFDQTAQEASGTSGYDLDMAYDKILSAKSLEGLLTGKALRRGYCEILQNVLAEFGIKSNIITWGAKTRGEASKYKLGPNTWNQVELDGKWYNCDLTHDADFALEGLKLPNFLRSNADIERLKEAMPQNSEDLQNCEETVSDELQAELVGYASKYVNELEVKEETEKTHDKEKAQENVAKKRNFILRFFDFIKSKFKNKDTKKDAKEAGPEHE